VTDETQVWLFRFVILWFVAVRVLPIVALLNSVPKFYENLGTQRKVQPQTENGNDSSSHLMFLESSCTSAQYDRFEQKPGGGPRFSSDLDRDAGVFFAL